MLKPFGSFPWPMWWCNIVDLYSFSPWLSPRRRSWLLESPLPTGLPQSLVCLDGVLRGRSVWWATPSLRAHGTSSPLAFLIGYLGQLKGRGLEASHCAAIFLEMWTRQNHHRLCSVSWQTLSLQCCMQEHGGSSRWGSKGRPEPGPDLWWDTVPCVFPPGSQVREAGPGMDRR